MKANNTLPEWHHRTNRRGIMSEQPNELKKLTTIAADLQLAGELRTKSIELIGNMGSHEALLALLDLVANEKLIVEERDLALKQARRIIKSSR